MLAHGDDYIETQVILANRDAKHDNQSTISGRLGFYNEYYFEYEWSPTTHDGYPVLTLSELSYTLSDDDERVIKKSMATHPSSQNTRLQKYHHCITSSPLPYLIAFEKLASSSGRRLRISNIFNDSIRSYLMANRGYSVQSDDDSSLIDKC